METITWGSHLMAFTSLVWPCEKSIWHTLETDYSISEMNLFEVRFSTWNDFTGLSWFNWHTWICLSVEQEAKLSSDFLKRRCAEERNLEDDQEVGLREYIYSPVHIESGGGVEGELLFAASCCCVPDYRCPATKHFCISIDRPEVEPTCQLLHWEWNSPSCSISARKWDPGRRIMITTSKEETTAFLKLEVRSPCAVPEFSPIFQSCSIFWIQRIIRIISS